MRAQAFVPQLAVEALDEVVLHRPSGSDEVELDTTLVPPTGLLSPQASHEDTNVVGDWQERDPILYPRPASGGQVGVYQARTIRYPTSFALPCGNRPRWSFGTLLVLVKAPLFRSRAAFQHSIRPPRTTMLGRRKEGREDRLQGGLY